MDSIQKRTQTVLLLLYISGNETKDASKVHLSTVAQKPEEMRKPVNKGTCYVNQKHQGKPLLFHAKCCGFFDLH